ncbi:MAG: DUF445 domain-containing protein [Leptothrix sp. (in: b-proteobacteria)]
MSLAADPPTDLAAGRTEASKRRELRRFQWFATGLLIAMSALFVLARWQGRSGIWAALAAFAEAAMIGALADWFAVVALFRRPLGLPIPHTAIIPTQKNRLAENLALFIRDKFLDTETLLGKLAVIDPIGRLAAWLQEEKNQLQLGEKLQQTLAGLLDCLDDDRIRTLLRQALQQRLQQLDLSRAAGELLATLTAERRHQELLDHTLRGLSSYLDDAGVQKTLATMLVEVLGKEYPTTTRLVGSVTKLDDMGLKVSAAMVRSLNRWLHEIADDPQHVRRLAFDQAVEGFIQRLKTDPAYAARIEAIKQNILAEPAVTAYVHGLWDQLRGWLQNDLQNPDSRLRGYLMHAAAAMGRTLAEHPALRESLQEHLNTTLRAVVPGLRDGIARHIAQTVQRWDDAQLVRELELSVGKDLQFIRLNGTLVGGLIGLVLYGIDKSLG